MKKLGLMVSLIILSLCRADVFSQTEEQVSLYMFNPLLFNPAYAGTRGSINLVASGRFQWVGFEGAPRSQFLSFSAPVVGQSLGLGFHLSNDQIGARSRTSAFADISYGIKLNRKDHRLAFGMSGGADWQMYNFSRLYTTDPGDPAYGYYASRVRPNFGAGIYYYGERHYVGVSVPRLLRNRLGNQDIGENLQRRHFYVTAGYVFKINSVVDFKPSTLVKISENAPLSFDLNANFLFHKTLWVGAMYRFHEAVGLNMAVIVKNTVSIGYAFEFPVNGMVNARQWGSHEIMVGFDLRTKKKPVRSPRYF